MTAPANDNFKARVRKVTDKATGRSVIYHDFAKDRPKSVRSFIRNAGAITAAHEKRGMAAYFIVAFDNEMQPMATTFIDDHVPISNCILIAAVTEALRHRIIDHAIDVATGDHPEGTPPQCA